jgi:hypothetical protein
MADILHRLSMNAPPEEVYRALNGESLFATFGRMNATMRMVRFEEGARIAWQCTDGPPEWIGTEISVELERGAGETVVSLAHKNWTSPSLFMAQCTTGWARALFQLKRWVETPEPDDLAAE